MEAAALKLESLACIDSTTLSHSELLALSLSSLCAFDLRATNDLVTPKIDPALFNESAGSRRQTYSRPQSSPTGRRRRLAGLLPAPKLPPLPAHNPENAENRLIIDYLKQLIREDPKFDQVHLAPHSLPQPTVKRKRGRKPKLKLHLEHCYRGIDILNQKGVAIDLSQLATSQDPFADELKRRTQGLNNEEELLGFLRDLPGQWGSRRKKRRIVDAADFGDVLPVSWKILLGLKRKDGRAWIYCRRYISPSGQHFVSCKEVSSYLQSLLGNGDAQLQSSRRSENVVQEQIVPAENSAGVTPERQDQRPTVATEMPGLFGAANERVREVALLGIENLADVQIHDLFECRKCNMSFDEKDSYLQHLLSVHQRTTRRYRLGSSVGDGVIIKDGKFECQFCHKVFLERRRYNGHVGIHVRNYVRRVDDSPGQTNVQRTDDKSPVREDVPLRISKMDALIEIAQNSIMEGSVPAPPGPHQLAKPNWIPASDIAAGYMDQDGNSQSPIGEKKMEDSLTKTNVDHHDMDGKVEEIDDDNHVIDVKMVTFLDNMGLLSVNNQDVKASGTSDVKDDVELTIEELDQSGIDLDGVSEVRLLPLSELNMIPESEKSENSGCSNARVQFKLDEDTGNNSELEFGLNCLKDVPVTVSTDVEMVMAASEENVEHSRAFNSSISTEQLDSLTAFSSDKGGKQFSSLDNEHDNVKGLQELRFDEIDNVDYDFARVQDSPTLPAVPTELANNRVMEETYASSVPFQSHEDMLNIGGRDQLTTVCVWCGIEFNHDAVNSEIQPDSVGFMCPACKAKISGQINVLDCESPNGGCL